MIDSEKYREGKVKLKFISINLNLKFSADKQLELLKVTTYLLYNGSTSLFKRRA